MADPGSQTPPSVPQPHVVIVDDDASVRETLEEFLAQRGLAVTTADGGAALRRIMAERPADLVLLDLNMPGEDGLTLARYLREETKAAVVMLTSAGEVVDRIIGLELGADDYIAKPFDLREVLARIRSVLRHPLAEPAVPQTRRPPAPRPDDLRFGRFVLNLSSHRLLADDGAEVALTALEFDLLKALAMHPGKRLTRQQIVELAHGDKGEPRGRSLDIRITRLRQKIEIDPSRPRLIRTVQGVGYIFVPDEA